MDPLTLRNSIKSNFKRSTFDFFTVRLVIKFTAEKFSKENFPLYIGHPRP